MTQRSKDIGTSGESAVVRFLRKNGFPHAERRALTGSLDQGDITGCLGLVWEVKAGNAARTASDAQILEWLKETEAERKNAGADHGFLVTVRAGVGPNNAGNWWVHTTTGTLLDLFDDSWSSTGMGYVVRMRLADIVTMLRGSYGEPLS